MDSSSFNCEVSIIRGKNLEFINKPSGEFFVRCFFSAGNNKRVQLSTREISSSDDIFWNECFSLECLGTEPSIQFLRQGNVVFELRWRSSNISKGSFLGKLCGSKLLGRAEIPWKNVFESPNMEIEAWVQMISKNHGRVNQDGKPPKVQVRMKVTGAPAVVAKSSHNDGGLRRRREESCGCEDGCGCRCVDYIDYDLFALGCA